MKEDLVSIILPIYNVEAYLRQSLDSIINQTYKNLEIILVDDGSPDNSGNICDEYAKKDSRIKVIHKKNGGVSSARNIGLDNATGDFISFIDPDDYVANNFIEKLHYLCIKNNTDLVECNFIKFMDKVEIEECEEETIITTREMQKRLYSENYIRTCVLWDKLCKSYVYENIRFPEGKINEDEAMIHRIIDNVQSQITVTNLQLYYYRSNDQSIMGKKFNVNRLDGIDALEDRNKFYKNKNDFELYSLAMTKYQNKVKDYYLMTKKYVDNPEKYLKYILKKCRGNYFKYLNCTTDNFNKIVKMTLFIVFPNFYYRLIENKME